MYHPHIPGRGKDSGRPFGHQFYTGEDFGQVGYQVGYDVGLDSPLNQLPFAAEAAFNSYTGRHEPTCLPNTRVDLLREIYSWADSEDERCIFWLSGFAGTGKSTVARTVARTYFDQRRLAASFFFSRGGGDVSQADKFVTSIAVQLAHNVPGLYKHTCDAITKGSYIASQSLRDQWYHLVLHPLSKLDGSDCSSSYVLVVDALDECDDDNNIRIILQLLAETRSLETVQLRLFLTSRPEILIRYGYSQIPRAEHQDFILHNISPPIIDHDISIFLEYNLRLIGQQNSLDTGWPGVEVIRSLVQSASGLFIWAATACRFISEGLFTERLRVLLEGRPSDAAATPEGHLNGIYITVLKNSVSPGYNAREKEEIYSRLRDVLGSIVALFSPLSVESLCRLLLIPKQKLDRTLRNLHSVLDIPKDQTCPLRLHHPAFRGFLFDRDRCRDPNFWVDAKQAHQTLADSCIRLMATSLKQDICGVDAPGVRVADVESARVKQCLPPELQYACLYWIQHLQKSGARLCDNDRVHQFLKVHLLHWLEALSWMRKVSEGIYAIISLESIALTNDCPDLYAFIRDMRRFALYDRQAMEQAPLLVYYSALYSAPVMGMVGKQFGGRVPQWMQILPEAEKDWNSLLQTPKGHSHGVNAVAFSPDGKVIASASEDKTVKLWDAGTGVALQTLKGHSYRVNAVAFSPDGKVLASASDDNTVKLWGPGSEAALTSVDNLASAPPLNEQDEQVSRDSDYASGTHGKSVQIWSSVGNDLEVITEDTECTHEGSASVGSQSPADKRDVQPLGLYTTDTIYTPSETSNLPPPRDKGYITDLAAELFGTVNSVELDRETLERISEMLPDLLRAFALKLGHKTQSPIHRDVSFFVHRYRSRIQVSFEDMFPLEDDTSSNVDRVQPGQFAIDRYLEEPNILMDQQTTGLGENNEYHNDEPGPTPKTDEDLDSAPASPGPNENDDALVDGTEPTPDAGLYRDFIVQTPAYSWLVASLQREATLTRATPDLMEDIKEKILGALPSSHRVSRKAPSQEYKATFELAWDPLSFVKEQQYTESPEEALERAITLTGAANDAQAMTTREYLCQTWPATGKHLMQLVTDVVRSNTDHYVASNLPDGTELDARIDGSKFIVTTIGTGDSIAEIGQQFAWLGAALRSSPFEAGVATCSPFVRSTRLENAASSTEASEQMPLVEIFCVIDFEMNEPDTSGERPPGQCWHNMFRNPVMVRGYPISTKRERGLGLEMPLNMIAGLAGSDRAIEFNGRVFIKGFSTMLVAIKLGGGLLMWHYLFNSKRERISYLDRALQDAQDTSLLQLDTARHVVGWSPDCKYYAGAVDAQYSIDGTGLPRPHPGAFLEKVTISGGKFITGGAIFAVGVNNVPPHLVRNGYIPKLMWMDTKYVVLWDEADKRGWLVNGTSALLHLVRASLMHYSTGHFSSVLLFEQGKMTNAAEHKPESAVGVLIDPNNRALEIWPGKSEISEEEEVKAKACENDTEASKSWKKKRGFTLLEDLVEQQYTILELIMEHHKHLAGQNGTNLKVRTRKHLEGWDFKELATGYDPRPRVATLHALGYGWVDFVRSIDAVTLLGCGFGDIIRPFEFDGMCPRWRRLPIGEYHLAASIFDLKRIMETFGGKGTGAVEPADGLLWHSPDHLFARCHCQEHNAHRRLTKIFRSHHNPVQVFCPKWSRLFSRPRKPAGLGNSGVVVFGHNVSWPYRWREGGNKDGEEDDLEGIPLITVHEPEVPIAPREASWEPAYSNTDLSVTGGSSRSRESTDGDMPRSLHSAYTALTTPNEPASRSTHDGLTLNAPSRINVPGQREILDEKMQSEYHMAPDRQVLNEKRMATNQRADPARQIVPDRRTGLDKNRSRTLRRERRRI